MVDGETLPGGSIRVFADFNCPFCYALEVRLRDAGLSEGVTWIPVEHAPGLIAAQNSPDELAELAAEVFTVRHRAPELLIRLPSGRPGTGAAGRLYVAVARRAPELAAPLRRALFAALWQHGRDLADPATLRDCCAEAGAGEVEPDGLDLGAMVAGQTLWQDGPYERRLPALVADDGRLILGLPTADELSQFVGGGAGRVAAASTCAFVPRPVVLVVGSTEGLWPTLSALTLDCDVRLAQDVDRALELVSEGSPDLVVLAAGLPGAAAAALGDGAGRPWLEDVPIVLAARAPTVEAQRAAFAAGATDVLDLAAPPDLLIARLTERLRTRQTMVRLRQQVRLDRLTGLPGRREFERIIELEWQRGARAQRSLSVVVLDIDFFKLFNDRHGHLHGDACLRAVASGLAGALRRAGDSLCRYGGEEFVGILPDSDLDAGIEVAERCVVAVRELRLPHGDSECAPYVTVSAGVAAARPGPTADCRSLIERADAALFDAKRAGRNRVAIAR